MNKLSANGYFSLLKHEGKSRVINVTTDAYEISELVNEAEADLKLDDVRTMITVIVSFGQPNHN